jgi:hypothetical protein
LNGFFRSVLIILSFSLLNNITSIANMALRE